MMKIVYDPKEGQVVSDANIEDFYKMYCRYLKHNLKIGKTMRVRVGSELIVQRFRLGVAEGDIPASQIEFWFEGKQLEMTTFGSYNGMPPKGFCDYLQTYIMRMSKKRRANLTVVE
jgi:hypothetical protein